MASVSDDQPFYGVVDHGTAKHATLYGVTVGVADWAGKLLIAVLAVMLVAIVVAFGAILDDERAAPPAITASQNY